MSNGTVSWGGERSHEYHQSWETSGSGEKQIHAPASEEDHAVRDATGRLGSALFDTFQDLGTNPLGAAGQLVQSFLTGESPNMDQFLGQAEFDPAQLSQDLRTIAQGLQDRPVDTLQNMVLGAPTEAIDATLDGLDAGLEQLEDQTGLKHETQGSLHEQYGESRRYELEQQLGDVGNLESETTTHVGGEFNAEGSAEVGIAGVEAEGSFDGHHGATLHSESELDTILGTATNQTDAYAGVQYEGQGSIDAGINGIEAQGSVGARAGVGVNTQGRLENALGQANYYGVAKAEAFANADGTATLDASGLQAHANAEIGVTAAVEAGADFQTAGVDIGGEPLDIRGQGRVRLEASAIAQGHADVNATINPPRANADLYGEAFAGVKAEAEGEIGVGEFVTLSGHAGAWAGAGAEGGVHLGYDDGKLSFGFGGGAAVGYGFGAGWGVEVDVKSVANAAIGGTIDAVEQGIEYALDPSAAINDAANTIDAVGEGISDAVDTANTVVEEAGDVIDDVVDWLIP